MKFTIKLAGFCLLIFTLSCQSDIDPEMYQAMQAWQVPSSTDQGTEKYEAEIERKLIKEGRVEFETQAIDSTRNQILKSLQSFNGYTSSDDTYKSPGRIQNTLVVRVHAEHFDAMLEASLKGISSFDSKEIQVKDVTEEFLDVEARVKTKKEMENRYLALLQRANTVTEMLEVEKQLGELRAEIESMEGRLKYLQNRVAFSTITFSFYQKVPQVVTFGNKFVDGFQKGWDLLIWFFVALTYVWPFLLLIGGYWVWRKTKK